jgi:hypothetical protein
MREVPSMGKVEPENRVAGFRDGTEYRSARLGTGGRLHDGVLRTEQSFGSLDGEALHDVHVFAAAVVAAAGVALGVLIGQD